MRVLAILTAFSAAALAGCGTSPSGGSGKAPPPAPPAPGPPPLTGPVAGKAVFQANCIACHGENGRGIGKGKPDFTDAAWQAKESDAALLDVIANGHHNMPPFKDKLTEQQRKDVLAYIRTLAVK